MTALEIIASCLKWAIKNWKPLLVAAVVLLAFAYVQKARATARELVETRATLEKTTTELTAEREAGALARFLQSVYQKKLAEAYQREAKNRKKVQDGILSTPESKAWGEQLLPAAYRCARWGVDCDGVLSPP